MRMGSSLTLFDKFTGNIVFKEDTAFVTDEFICGQIPFEWNGSSRNGEVSRETLLSFLSLNSGRFEFSTDKKQHNLLLTTEGGATFKTPFKVIDEDVEFTQYGDPVQILVFNWEELQGAFKVSLNIGKMGENTTVPEAMGVVLENSTIYVTDLFSCLVIDNLGISEPCKTRIVIPKSAVKILMSWMEHFGHPLSIALCPGNRIEVGWDSGAILGIQAPFIAKPIPLKERTMVYSEGKTRVPISEGFRKSIAEISKLGDYADLHKNTIKIFKEGFFEYTKELGEEYTSEKLRLGNLSEFCKFLALSTHIYLPLNDISAIESENGSIKYIFSPKAIR